LTSLSLHQHAIALSYCANVHPAENFHDVQQTIQDYTARLQVHYGGRSQLGMGLWISQAFSQELLQEASKRQALKTSAQEKGLYHFTLNGFPYGRFHQERIKEKVFQPSWRDPARLQYLKDLARLLSQLLDDSLPYGSISTLSGSYKPLEHHHQLLQEIAHHHLTLIEFLYQLEQETGKRICIALEPEPLNTLENTDEALAYFKNYLWASAPKYPQHSPYSPEELVRRYLGICFDTCHQACQFESLPESLKRYQKEGVPLYKIQLSNALHLESPATNPEGIAHLRQFQEPVYLHQILGKSSQGQILAIPDLETFFKEVYPHHREKWNALGAWRIHFHVPLFYQGHKGLKSTQKDLEEALAYLLKEDLCSHFEIETYTWNVLPVEPEGTGLTLFQGLQKEIDYVFQLFRQHGVQGLSSTSLLN
jgi:hypothetical protein